MQRESILVSVRQATRLDVFLTRLLPHVSRNRVQRHIERGDVLVDGERVRSSHRLIGGERLRLRPFETRNLAVASQEVDFDIAYEDAHLVVVDKPTGVLVHPVGREFRTTLLNGLHHLLRGRREDVSELGIVHRLDRLTSGLLVIAKTLEARRRLGAAVEAHSMRRTYVAFVLGRPVPENGEIRFFIRRDPTRPTRMQAVDWRTQEALRLQGHASHVSASGYSDPRRDLRPRAALTHYKILRRFSAATLLQLRLETGRTHQIRVHLQAAGTPLLGDPIYGPDRDRVPASALWLQRPALHAARLDFRHPITEKLVSCRARLPEDLRQLATDLA